MTEKSCIVTLSSEQANYKILNNPDDREILYCNSPQWTSKIQDSQIEISLKNRPVNFFEIDKNVINVTNKDAPCGVSDQFIATLMSKYG